MLRYNVILGEPDESKVLRFGVDDPLVQIIKWSPWQLQVIPRQQFLLPVSEKEANYWLMWPVYMDFANLQSLIFKPQSRQNNGNNVLLKWGTTGSLKEAVIVGKWFTTPQSVLNMTTANSQTCLQTQRCHSLYSIKHNWTDSGRH